MKNIIYILLFTTVSAFAQKKPAGFLGKKTVLDLSGIGHFRVINNLIRTDLHYQETNGRLVNKKKWFEYGGQIGINRVISNHFMMGIQASFYRQYSIVRDDFYYTNTNYPEFDKHEMVDINTVTIAPKLEFAPNRGLLPMGFSHCLSIGFTMNNIKDRPYLISYYDYTTNSNKTTTINYKKEPTFKEISATYSLKSRIPLTKSLMFNYSLNYHLNIPFGNGTRPFDVILNDLYFEGIDDNIYQSRLYSIFTFNAGLSLAF